MFVPPLSELSKDDFERQVSFGGWTFQQFFDRRSSNFTPLPPKPPAAGTRCLCPSCLSEGWYASSPVCRFWRAHCELCSGTRRYYDRALREHLDCDDCQYLWTEDVNFFRDALRNPNAVVRRVRAGTS